MTLPFSLPFPMPGDELVLTRSLARGVELKWFGADKPMAAGAAPSGRRRR